MGVPGAVAVTARVSNRFGYAAISAYAVLLVAAVVVAVMFGDKILVGSAIRPSTDLLEARTGSIRVYDGQQRNCTQYAFDNVTGHYTGAAGQPCSNLPATAPPIARDEVSSFQSIQRALRGR